VTDAALIVPRDGRPWFHANVNLTSSTPPSIFYRPPVRSLLSERGELPASGVSGRLRSPRASRR